MNKVDKLLKGILEEEMSAEMRTWLIELSILIGEERAVGRSEQFNCLGGNYAKGITECKEWCGEDMCQKPSN
jgi:hypothetical protein